MKNDGKFSNWHSVRRLIAQGNIFSLVILNLNEKLLIFLHLTYSGTQAEADVLQHVENAYRIGQSYRSVERQEKLAICRSKATCYGKKSVRRPSAMQR